MYLLMYPQIFPNYIFHMPGNIGAAIYIFNRKAIFFFTFIAVQAFTGNICYIHARKGSVCFVAQEKKLVDAHILIAGTTIWC